MDKYTYLILGVLLGLGIAMYLWANREEKIEREINVNKKIYSTKKLNITMEAIVNLINQKIKEVKRELTEEEKDEIIVKCCKEKFYL